MNRIINFKALDMDTQSWLYFGVEGIPKEKENRVDYTLIHQFTGLHDKNGKDIYEGDIYQTRYGKNYKIMFINGCFVGGKTDNFCSPMGWEADVDGDDLIESNYCLQVEIIGNIYENPELCNH